MYIVNTTYVVDPAVDASWRRWLAAEFVPLLGGAHAVFTRVLAEEAAEHLTYSLQVDAPDVPSMQQLRLKTAQPTPFGERVLCFTTVLKKIEL